MTCIRVTAGVLLLVLCAVSFVVPQVASVITGNGTANCVPEFTGTTTIGNSAIYQNAAGVLGSE